MILMIDNYDSFTYNIVHYLEAMDYSVVVKTPDMLSITSIENMNPDVIIISPGPGHPVDQTLCIDVVNHFKGVTPILGICLGFQVIVTCYGGLVEERLPVHGFKDTVFHDGKGMFKGIKNPLHVGRYHSLQATQVNGLEITARTASGIIMGVRDIDNRIEAVQYHPESILTEFGKEQLKAFLEVRK